MNTIVGNESSLTVGRSSQQEDGKYTDRYLNFILAGDLGGTNTRLAFYTKQEEKEEEEEETTTTIILRTIRVTFVDRRQLSRCFGPPAAWYFPQPARNGSSPSQTTFSKIASYLQIKILDFVCFEVHIHVLNVCKISARHWYFLQSKPRANVFSGQHTNQNRASC